MGVTACIAKVKFGNVSGVTVQALCWCQKKKKICHRGQVQMLFTAKNSPFHTMCNEKLKTNAPTSSTEAATTASTQRVNNKLEVKQTELLSYAWCTDVLSLITGLRRTFFAGSTEQPRMLKHWHLNNESLGCIPGNHTNKTKTIKIDCPKASTAASSRCTFLYTLQNSLGQVRIQETLHHT